MGRRGSSSRVARIDEIRSYLYTHGFSSIQALADAVGASLPTIRRDLNLLEGEGVIDRSHGGARLAEGSSVEVAFQEREKQNLGAKRAIAAAAYSLVSPRATLFLDAGTTVLQLARLIRVSPMPLRIFTNGLAVAQEFLNVPDLDVVLIGGQLRSENASLVGPHAEEALQSLWFDHLFLGASAIGPDGAIYSIDGAEANLNRHMIERSAQRHVLADSSKFGTMATYRVGPLSLGNVITDSGLSAKWQRTLGEMGVRLTIASET